MSCVLVTLVKHVVRVLRRLLRRSSEGDLFVLLTPFLFENAVRFQLKMVYGCGHSVQEDQPDETAASIINFATR